MAESQTGNLAVDLAAAEDNNNKWSFLAGSEALI